MTSAQNIIVIVEGGVVQEVTFPSLDSPAVEVRDYDVQGCDSDGKGLSIDQDGDPYIGYVWEPGPEGVDAVDPEEVSILTGPEGPVQQGWYYVREDTDGNAVGRYPLTEAEAITEAWAESGMETPAPPSALTERLHTAEARRRVAGQALDAIRQKYAHEGEASP